MVIIIENEQFAKTVKQYERLILTICLSFTKNYFDAEDLAQQTFLNAYMNYDKFDGKNLKAWLTTIAANKCRDFLKSKSRTDVSLTDEEYDNVQDDSESPEEAIIKKNTEEKISSLCSRLKEPYKNVAENYFLYGIKLSSMAKASGENIKTLETRLYRAKKLLKELWKEEFM